MPLRILTFLAAIAFLAACGGGNQQDLFVDAVDYAAMQPEGGYPGDPADAIYHACIDTETLYEAALTSAKERGTPLMVVWGFNECPLSLIHI